MADSVGVQIVVMGSIIGFVGLALSALGPHVGHLVPKIILAGAVIALVGLAAHANEWSAGTLLLAVGIACFAPAFWMLAFTNTRHVGKNILLAILGLTLMLVGDSL